jgi:hypothetical protein
MRSWTPESEVRGRSQGWRQIFGTIYIETVLKPRRVQMLFPGQGIKKFQPGIRYHLGLEWVRRNQPQKEHGEVKPNQDTLRRQGGEEGGISSVGCREAAHGPCCMNTSFSG